VKRGISGLANSSRGPCVTKVNAANNIMQAARPRHRFRLWRARSLAFDRGDASAQMPPDIDTRENPAMTWSSFARAAAFAGAAAIFAPNAAQAGLTYDIFPQVIEGFEDYTPWVANTIRPNQPPLAGTLTFDAKTGTAAQWIPELEAHADGSVTGIVEVNLANFAKGLPISDEVPVVGRSNTKRSEKGLVLPVKAIVNEHSFSASLSFAGTKTAGAEGNAFSVKFAGKAKESVKPGGVVTGSRDITAKVNTTVGALHKGSGVTVVNVVLEPSDNNGIDVARGEFFGESPVVVSKPGSYQANAFFLSDFAAAKGLSDGSLMRLSMTARRVGLPFPKSDDKILPGQFGKFSISATDGPYKFSGKGYHFKTAAEIEGAGNNLQTLVGGAGYLGMKFSGPAGSHSRSMGIGGALP